ncbi:hypothetical protein ACFPRL_30825 [Pseudoclavibacter helvolus]
MRWGRLLAAGQEGHRIVQVRRERLDAACAEAGLVTRDCAPVQHNLAVDDFESWMSLSALAVRQVDAHRPVVDGLAELEAGTQRGKLHASALRRKRRLLAVVIRLLRDSDH